MEPDIENLEQAIQGLAVMSAIPVVLLGLWADYWGRSFDQLVLDDSVEKAELETVELEKVKTASLCALVSQILLFLGSADLRDHYPVVSPVIFVVAVLFQILIQTQAESKIQKQPKNREDVFGISLRATFYWILGIVVHIFFLGLAAGATGLLIQKFQPPLFVEISTLAVTGVCGLAAGIIVNLALSPFYFKRIFPMRKLEEGRTRTKIEACFSKFGITPPDLWVIELRGLRVTQNILVGLKGSTGALRPSLFISSLVLETLSENEVEALTLNQVSHLVLKHSEKRGFLILALISVTTFLPFVSIFVGQSFPASEPVIEIMGTIISSLAFLGSFRALYLQTSKHEAESDIYTVEKMGVACENLSNALRKLDILADPGGSGKTLVGFPETERRIKLFESAATNLAPKDYRDKAA